MPLGMPAPAGNSRGFFCAWIVLASAPSFSPGRGGVFLPHLMGKWADAQHRVEGAARQRRIPASPAPLSAARTPPHEMGRKTYPHPRHPAPYCPSLFTTRGPARSGRGWGGNGASWKAGLTHGTEKTAIRGSKSAEVWLQYPPGLEYPPRGGRKSPCAGCFSVSLTNSLATMPDGVPHPSYRQRDSAWRFLGCPPLTAQWSEGPTSG